MSQPDLTTFYSTLAQVSATIVALLGAVLGSRIIDLIPRLQPEKRSIDLHIGILKGFLLSNRIPLARTVIEEEIERDTAAIGRREKALGTRRTVLWDMTIVQEPTMIEDIPRHRTDLESKRELLPHLEEIYALRDPINDANEASNFVERLRGESQDRPEPLKGALNRDADGLESVLREIAQFRTKVLPRSLGFIFIVLSWFAFVGVLWPLAALPNRRLMFFAFAAGLLPLIGYFIWQFIELRELRRFRW